MSKEAGLVRPPAAFLLAAGIVLVAGLAFFLMAERTWGEEPAAPVRST